MIRKINKNNFYYIAGKNNDIDTNWDSFNLHNLEDVLLGIIFLLYKEPETTLNCLSFLQRPGIIEHIDNKLNSIFESLNFPDYVDKSIIKENIYLSTSIQINKKTNKKLFKV